ncbi:4'-phosphopantetheinyl transferase family protein [Arthrobacter sp. TWP1-1]|uniref:4'-phosphopantetheinyl transferase family protein n=1 Tax=Arthrobacter sp. TWP1-1 TaxID=2804568 RepID=UPI003CF28915
MNELGRSAILRGQVEVRAFELAAVDQRMVSLLDPAETARAATIADETTHQDFIAGRVAQRLMAADLLDAAPQDLATAYSCPDCGANPVPSHGRPGYLLRGVPAALSISFSRSHGWALSAMVLAAKVPLGADLQNVAQVAFDGFDDVALSSAEKAHLARLTAEGRDAWRAAAWARKEALAKYFGLGLRIDPTLIEAFPGKENGKQGPAAAVWDVESASVGLPEGFAAAVASSASA